LLVDWFGVTVTTVVLVAAPLPLLDCANTLCDVWLWIPRIIAVDAMIIIKPAAAIIVVVVFLLFIFFIRRMLSSYDYKHRDKFQLWIPKLELSSLF
jgi:hypothetical protein